LVEKSPTICGTVRDQNWEFPIDIASPKLYTVYVSKRHIGGRTILEEAVINTSNRGQDVIPLREPTFFILLSLTAGPSHGYAIMKDVASLSDHRVRLSTSTLYTALKRQLDLAWIHREADPDGKDSGRERKFYRLTDLGREVLEAEVARLEGLVLTARKRVFGGEVWG
jgi:DNA-binding PadR family transcriptional regulator